MHINKAPSFTVYQPSGKIGLRACLVFLLACVPMAIVLGVGLAWAQSYAHGWIASSICATLHSLFVYLICGLVVGSLHARNRTFLAAAGVVFGIFLLTSRWVFVRLTCPDCTNFPGAWMGSAGRAGQTRRLRQHIPTQISHVGGAPQRRRGTQVKLPRSPRKTCAASS